MPEKMPNWTEKFGYGEFIHLEHRECDACMMKGDKVFRIVGPNSFKEEVRRKDMEDTGVNIQVLSTIPVLFNYWAKPLDGYQTSRFFNDHIAATVNTLVLAYAGASLPLLVLFATGDDSWTRVVNREIVAEEVVRTLVGSIGLIAAVPITTLIASLLAVRTPPAPTSELNAPVSTHHHH